MKLGVIGSGQIGSCVAGLAVAANIDVVVANSRGPQSLSELIAHLGPLASAGTVGQVVEESDIVVLAIPLLAIKALPEGLLRNKIVLDATNYYPFRDGRVAELDSESVTTSELVLSWLDGARLVKAFNNVMAGHIATLARPLGAPDRNSFPIASNDGAAKLAAAEVMSQLGFDTVDAGSLADSWRFEPESSAYLRIYVDKAYATQESLRDVPSRQVASDELRAALAAAQRVRVAERTL